MQHPIQVVVRRTGLTADTVRVWERRYAVVRPLRGANNERLYSEADIGRLQLLQQATEHGFRIGGIASLADDNLEQLVADAQAAEPARSGPGEPRPTPTSAGPAGDAVAAGLGCIEAFDSPGLVRVLDQALVDFGELGVVFKVLTPLLAATGELWRRAEVRVGHEHLASATLRTWLGQVLARAQANQHGQLPGLVVCTPSGQHHELGALMAGVLAASQGWQVVWLGPNLPIEEIAFAAQRSGARGVALGLSYPLEDPDMAVALARLRQHLPASVSLVAGGAASASQAAELAAVGLDVCPGVEAFMAWLDARRGRC